MVSIKRERRRLAEQQQQRQAGTATYGALPFLADQLESQRAGEGYRILTLPDGLEFSEIKQDEHMAGKPPPASKGIGGTTRQPKFVKPAGGGYQPQVGKGAPTTPPNQGSAGKTPSRFETITLPDGLEFRELSGPELASRLIKPKFTPNPVKRKCGRCERLRAYARRMLAKVSGKAG